MSFNLTTVDSIATLEYYGNDVFYATNSVFTRITDRWANYTNSGWYTYTNQGDYNGFDDPCNTFGTFGSFRFGLLP